MPNVNQRLVAIVSFRLGGPDGVSVVAGHWRQALCRLGLPVRTVAGAGRADRLGPGLAMDAAPRLDLAGLLAGRPAILHHHDLPWQREGLAERPGWPPDDPAWRHVTINERSRKELAVRGIVATTVYGGFPVPRPGRRALARGRLGVGPGRRLLLQP